MSLRQGLRNNVTHRKYNWCVIPEHITKEILIFRRDLLSAVNYTKRFLLTTGSTSGSRNTTWAEEKSLTTKFNCSANEQKRSRTTPASETELVDCCDRRGVWLILGTKIDPLYLWISHRCNKITVAKSHTKSNCRFRELVICLCIYQK